MPPAAFEIVKRTPIDGDRVIITARRSKPHLLRPFATFTVTNTSRYAQRLVDYATEAAALHAHDVMVKGFTQSKS